MSESERHSEAQRRWPWSSWVPLIPVVALVGYKAMGAMHRLQTGALPTAFTGDPLERSLAYLKTIWPALVFGVVIAGSIRVFVQRSLLMRLLGKGMRSQLVASAAATPLMLCSCCTAPLFAGVYEATGRAAPALALTLGAPSLNLAALALTFVLLGTKFGLLRVGMALLAVLIGTLVAERMAGLRVAANAAGFAPDPELAPSPGLFVRSVAWVALQTVPVILIGIIASSWLSLFVQPSSLLGLRPTIAVLLAATVALPLALPTFFELPLALTLVAAGLPAGAAVAVLFAGPAINLPSLLTIARASSWKLAVGLAAVVWTIAVAGGLLASLGT